MCTCKRLAALLLLGLFLAPGIGCFGSGKPAASTAPKKEQIPVANDPLNAGKNQAGAKPQ